jgi:hypothetical protein
MCLRFLAPCCWKRGLKMFRPSPMLNKASQWLPSARCVGILHPLDGVVKHEGGPEAALESTDEETR